MREEKKERNVAAAPKAATTVGETILEMQDVKSLGILIVVIIKEGILGRLNGGLNNRWEDQAHFRRSDKIPQISTP